MRCGGLGTEMEGKLRSKMRCMDVGRMRRRRSRFSVSVNDKLPVPLR
jgi:hypothetical protein